jgi:hypothetical protein
MSLHYLAGVFWYLVAAQLTASTLAWSYRQIQRKEPAFWPIASLGFFWPMTWSIVAAMILVKLLKTRS